MAGNENMAILKERIECPRCGTIGEYSGFEVICPQCDTVLKSRLIDRSPVIISEDEQGKNETNATQPKKERRTGFGTKVGTGRYIHAKNERTLTLLWRNKRLNHKYCSQSLDRSLQELMRCCKKLRLPEHLEESSVEVYRKLYDKKWTRAKPLEETIAGILMTVCREYDIIRTPSEIAEATGMEDGGKARMQVMRRYQEVVNELDMDYNRFRGDDYAKRLCEDFNIYGDLRKEVIHKVAEVEKEANANPRTVAGAVLYELSNDEKDITQKDVSEKIGITTMSLMNIKKEYGGIIND